MAEPHMLQAGDRVTHPDWPERTIRTVLRLYPFQRLTRTAKGRSRLVDG